MISLIAAAGKNNVIGSNNKLPWSIPEDLKYFKKTTSGKTIVMGRKTYESIGRPLPNRQNVILTKNQNYTAPDCLVINSKEELSATENNDEIFIIGGSQIYKLFWEQADRIYLTRIDKDFEGDAYFPDINPEKWQLTSSKKETSGGGLLLDFQIWERTKQN